MRSCPKCVSHRLPAASFCCLRSIWDQLCTASTQAGFSERSRNHYLLSFGISLLNQTFLHGHTLAFVFICSNVYKIWFGTSCIAGDLERGVTAALSVVFGEEHVGSSCFLPQKFPTEGWQKGEIEQLCHQTGTFLLEAYYSHCKLLQYQPTPHNCRARDFVHQWPFCRVMSRFCILILSQAVSGPGSVALRGCLRCWTGHLWIDKLIFLAKGV